MKMRNGKALRKARSILAANCYINGLRPLYGRMKKLKVVDLFCGAGGFSEGFRRVGFEIVSAVDSWKTAAGTFSTNHPETRVLVRDVSKLDPAELGETDVLIGSPPCNHFSYSNNGGNGDLDEGLRLVVRFLELLIYLKPKYWIVENVPRLLSLMPGGVFANQMKVGGETIMIPRKTVLNAADFGVPQRRSRLLMGSFPMPLVTHSRIGSNLQSFSGHRIKQWVPMRRIIEALPNPTGPCEDTLVIDPNYPDVYVPAASLSDHSYDSSLSPRQVSTNRAKKMHHPWCGRMEFPDSLDKPARTVTAVQAKTGRETIVIESEGASCPAYRVLTAREYACLQTFPITYKFACKGTTAKVRMIGNAFPPMMASALGKAILAAEGE